MLLRKWVPMEEFEAAAGEMQQEFMDACEGGMDPMQAFDSLEPPAWKVAWVLWDLMGICLLREIWRMETCLQEIWVECLMMLHRRPHQKGYASPSTRNGGNGL